MPIKRNSCRISERKKMREMHAEGYSIPQISAKVSVHEHIVTDVLDGTWAAAEAKQKEDQKRSTAEFNARKQTQAQADAEVVATAVAKAISGEDTRSPQQKAADTRKANKAAAEAAEQEQVEIPEAG